MTVRWSQIPATEFRKQLRTWKKAADYHVDTFNGVRLAVTKHWAGGKLVGREMNNRAERRTVHMVRTA